ncbi:MAG: AAA family ATPase, partial [Acidobacteriota bacterium]
MSKLKLHALEISGFKSFLDPVELRFADGITAIVGPNGCGKSNLTDAITWVLGEQSAKSLRGAKMEDVIFSGSDKRKPVGMAQVELTFEADGGFEMAQDGLIRIGRQVVRDGPSRYRLNGRTVRLKEIKDLLMDTGLGTRAYSVIEQGKIGMILSSKPQERRRLLEEAAGVTRYKARKRVAEVKLEETSANLLRLDDIISEAQRAVRSLKRQASAARRFKIKQEEADSLLRQVLLGRYGRLRERLDGLDLQVLDATRREAESTAELARDEAELVARRERLDELSAALGARHQTLADLGATIEGRQEFLRGSSQRRSEMDERLRRGRDEAELRRQQAAELQQSIGSLDERTSEVMAQRDDAARQVAADQERLGALERKVTAAQASLEGLRRDQMRSMGELDKVRSRLQRTTTDLEKLAYRDRFLDDERERLDGRLADSDRSLAEIDEEIAEARLALDDAEERRQRLDADLDRVLRSEADTIERRRELESELRGLEQRRKILAEL